MSSAALTRESVELWLLDDEDGNFAPASGHQAAADDTKQLRGRDARGQGERGQAERDEWRRAEFEILADELADAADGVSSTRRLRNHPAYIGILALGEDAIPLLLERLRTGARRPTWLTLLGSLTTLPPAAGTATIDDAAKAWLRWEKHGLNRFADAPGAGRRA